MSYSKEVIDHYENPRNVGSLNRDAIKAVIEDCKRKNNESTI